MDKVQDIQQAKRDAQLKAAEFHLTQGQLCIVLTAAINRALETDDWQWQYDGDVQKMKDEVLTRAMENAATYTRGEII